MFNGANLYKKQRRLIKRTDYLFMGSRKIINDMKLYTPFYVTFVNAQSVAFYKSSKDSKPLV